MRKRILITALFGAALLLIAGCGTTNAATGLAIETYKSPNCGCCGQWAASMQGDYDVNVNPIAEVESIKTDLGIPREMWSCHTSKVEGYFVEGHIPQEAISKLLAEKPDIDGIAMPGMPSGSPGMPGPKRGPWTIYAVKDGQVSEFMTI